MSQKKEDAKLMAAILLNLSQFWQFFHQPRLLNTCVFKWLSKIPQHLRHVAPLPCGIFLFSNECLQALNEANHHTRLSVSKQLLKNVRPTILSHPFH